MSAYNNITPDISTIKPKIDFDRGISPVWAQILYQGVEKRDKLKKTTQALKDDPSLAFKALLGKSLLDRHIDPFFAKMLPDSVKLDVLKQRFKYSPTKKLDLTLGKKGDDPKLTVNWRF